jgi:regulatory protein
MLKQKRIPDDYIEEALLSIEPEEYNQMIWHELSIKSRQTKARNSYERKSKLFRYASSRGYESGIVYPMLDNLLAGDDI